jgi:putative ABC transport system permease protein
MALWLGAISQGLIYAFMALGIYLTFRILDFPDLTVDGSMVTGAAVTAILIVNGMHPLPAILIAICVGSLAGGVTGFIHTKFHINSLLSGILVMTALYSVNLHIMGRSNLPLMRERTVLTLVENLHLPIARELVFLLFFLILVIVFRMLLVWFLQTDLGLAIRATGDNPQMITAQGVNITKTKILGLCISNGMVALTGSLIAQYQGFADAGMGIGMLVAGIASVIIGETLAVKKKMGFVVNAVIAGSVIFRLLIALALKAGLNPIDLKLITALFVFLALALPHLRSKLKK